MIILYINSEKEKIVVLKPQETKTVVQPTVKIQQQPQKPKEIPSQIKENPNNLGTMNSNINLFATLEPHKSKSCKNFADDNIFEFDEMQSNISQKSDNNTSMYISNTNVNKDKQNDYDFGFQTKDDKINNIQSNLGNLFTNQPTQPQSNQVNDKLFNSLNNNSYQNQNYSNGFQQYPYQQQNPYSNPYQNQYAQQQNYGNNYFNSIPNPQQEKIKLNYSNTNYSLKQEVPIENPKKNGKKDPFADLLQIK